MTDEFKTKAHKWKVMEDYKEEADRLQCTCGTSSGGTVQEEVERRMAARMNLSVGTIHALLDLMDVALDKVLDLPDRHRPHDGIESAREMAQRSGISLEFMTTFQDIFEKVTDDLDREGWYPTISDVLAMHGYRINGDKK